MAKKPNPFAKPGKPEKSEVAAMGKKAAAREEKNESPAERKREAQGRGKGK